MQKHELYEFTWVYGMGIYVGLWDPIRKYGKWDILNLSYKPAMSFQNAALTSVPSALKQGATSMPTNFRPQMRFQVIISVIGSCSQNEIRTPAP